MSLESSPTLVITGASGFVGSATVREAIRQGFQTIAALRHQRQTISHDGASVVLIHDYSELRAPPNAILVHLAEPSRLADAASAGGLHVAQIRANLTALLEQPWRHVVYASSVVVYGDDGMAAHHPEEPVHPADTYGQGKIACEAAVLARGGTVVRLANVFGPGQSSGTVIADLLSQLDGAGPIRVRNSGPERDYLWIDDAAAGLVAAASHQARGVFNLGSGQAISVDKLAQLVLSAAGRPSRAIESAAPPLCSRIAVDITDTIREFSWQPRTSLAEGIKRLVSPHR